MRRDQKPRTLPELKRRIEADGCTITQGRNHHRVLDRNGKYLMPLPVSPSDHRGIMNQWSMYRRLIRQRN